MKTTTLVLALMLLATATTSQQTQQDTGSGLQLLIRAIENNTQANQANQRKIEDINGRIEEQNTRFIGSSLMGNAVFITLLYVVFLIVDKVRKNKMKKQREEYIQELETEINHMKEGLIDTFKHQTEIQKKLINDNEILHWQIKRVADSIEVANISRAEMTKFILIGIILGAFTTAIIIYSMGALL